MAPRQLMKWDPKVHEDVLVAMFPHLTLAPEAWEKVMSELQQMGYAFTENALRQHVQKLRKNRDTTGIQAAASPAAAAAATAKAPPTPRKTAAAGSRKRRTPIKKAADDGSQEEDDGLNLKKEEDDLNDEAPAPKRSNKRVKREKVGKVEKTPATITEKDDEEETGEI
ncbi:hypothetical protein PT974_02455 [Cladobotryum mycophilum]|uniref:Uncharacterized protein n=1 Tax=Cladobotryum mycophilum TaxID=491253 RepID=A0ABR0SY72_9HYPO